MLAMRLVRLIEAHSEALSQGLAKEIRKSDRTTDFRKIPPEELRLAAIEVYRNLEEWLLQKTEADIAERFRAIIYCSFYGTKALLTTSSLSTERWSCSAC